MLKVENLYKKYDEKENDVIKNISIEFSNKGLVFLLGKSGSGKTTLLNLLGGIDSPTGGEIYLIDKKYSAMTEKQMDELRNADISFVFQDFNLLQNLNVIENVTLPLQILEDENDEAKKHAFAKEVLEKVGLSEYETRMPNELSGGQIQRVAIARAMIKSPKVLLADEPTGNLDSANGKVVFEALKKMAESCLVIIVTHDEEAAYKYGDRVIHIVDGIISSDKKLNSDSIDIEYNIVKNDVLIKSDVSKSKNVNNIIMAELNKCILENEDVSIKLDLKKRKKEQSSSENDEIISKDIKTKPFSAKEILRFAKNNMKNHKKHIAITIVLMILTIMLIMLSAILTDYNSIEPIEQYLNEHQIDRMNLYESVSYTNTFGDQRSKNLSVGEYFDVTLGEELLDNRIKVIEEEYIDYKMMFFGYSNVFLLNGDYRICNDIEIGEGEVIITDYVAESIGLGSEAVGKRITIGAKEYTIIACIDSIEESELAAKFNLFDEQQDMYESYYLENYFDVIFINESDYVSSIKEGNKHITTECADILNYKYERYYTKSVTIGSTDSLKGQELLYGEFPDEPDEILISSNYAIENGITLTDDGLSEGMFDIEFKFKDVYDGYDNYYTDILNLSDYMDGKVHITGVYDANTEYSTEYLVHGEIYKKMLDDYYKSYYYDRSVLYVEPDDYKNVISHIETYQSEIYEPSIDKIYTFELLINDIKNAIVFLLSVLTAIAIFMIYHNINISICYNKKTIGVLRSIGISKRCTIKIFLVEAIVICTFSSILATVFGIVVMNIANENIRAGVKINPYDLLMWDWSMSLVVILIEFAVFIFIAIIPILEYAKKPPIQIIRNN